MNANDPAFPVPSFVDAEGLTCTSVERGMTYRQWLAGKMMHALMSDVEGLREIKSALGYRWLEGTACGACVAADALIAELAKGSAK